MCVAYEIYGATEKGSCSKKVEQEKRKSKCGVYILRKYYSILFLENSFKNKKNTWWVFCKYLHKYIIKYLGDNFDGAFGVLTVL